MIGPLLVDISRELGVSVGQAGLLAAITALPQALSSPVAGLLSDRLGRRPMIVLSLAALGVLALAAAAAPTFLALAAVRFASGLLGSPAPTSLMASIGDLFRPERIARAMGWFNMGFSLAAIAGVPLMAAVAGLFGWRAAFATIGAVLLGATLAVRIWFPATRPRPSGTTALGTLGTLWRLRGLLNVLGANLLERSLFFLTTIYLPAFLMLAHGLTASAVAPVVSLVALGTVAGNLLGGWLGDRFRRPAIFVIAQATAGLLGLVVFGGGLGFPAAVALAALSTLANAVSRPAFLAYATDLAPAERGAMTGFLALSNQGGFITGSTVGAAVIGGSGLGLGLAALGLGALAAALALPLLRPVRLQ
jgi:DHA1 family inner membrane transport protein